MKRVTLALLLLASISAAALAESPVSGLTEAQFENLVAQLKTIYDERHPDVVLFGEDHCQVQPYAFLAAEATIGMHAGAHFVGAFIEEPAETQPWYDRIIANSLIKDPTPEQRRAAEALEEKMIRADAKSSAVDCPAGVTPANAVADVAMAKRLAAHDMAYRASDYTGDASEALQHQFAKTHDPALRRQFDAVRLDERRAAKFIRAAMSIGHVFAIRGAKHFLQKSDTAMRENLAGLNVLTFIFDDTGHTVGDAEATIKKAGFFAFNPPDYVIDVTPRHAGVYAWPESHRASK
jgi:L-amino acid N-acyltransferase YncA